MDAQLLTQVAMFSGLNQAALQDFYCHLTPRQVRPGDVLCRAGDAATSLFVLQRGVPEVGLGSPGHGAAIRSVARLRRGLGRQIKRGEAEDGRVLRGRGSRDGPSGKAGVLETMTNCSEGGPHEATRPPYSSLCQS